MRQPARARRRRADRPLVSAGPGEPLKLDTRLAVGRAAIVHGCAGRRCHPVGVCDRKRRVAHAHGVRGRREALTSRRANRRLPRRTKCRLADKRVQRQREPLGLGMSLVLRPVDQDRLVLKIDARLKPPQGKTDGPQWGDNVTAAGENRWPYLGRNRWPLTADSTVHDSSSRLECYPARIFSVVAPRGDKTSLPRSARSPSSVQCGRCGGGWRSGCSRPRCSHGGCHVAGSRASSCRA
jgi:hypothetical protein